MEINVLEHTKNRIKLEIVGEDHTLANALTKELWGNSNVKISGYRMEQTMVNNPILIVETEGSENPKKALLNAIESLRKTNKELLSDFSKLFK